jgi:hypothetical protein
VERVIGELCSSKLPENSELTGKFLFFSTLSYPKTARNPSNHKVSMRFLIEID